MKAKFTIMLAAVLAFAACQPEDDPQGGNEPGTSTSPESVEISARNTYGWKKADKVSVFDGYANNLFRSQGAGESATIAGECVKAATLYGLVPYDESASLAEDAISATLPDAQVLTAGAFPYMSVAKTTDPATMNFETVAAYLKVDIAEDAAGIESIKVSATAGETLAGKVKIDFKDGKANAEAQGNASQVSTTAFEGQFKASSTYYIAVLPGEYAEGFTVFYTLGGETHELALSGNQKLEAGDVCNLCTISRPLNANEKMFVGTWQVSKWGSRAYDDPTGQYAWISSNRGVPLPETTKDDVITFNADGSVKIDMGADNKVYNAAAEDAVGVELTGDETWSLVEDGESLTLVLSGNAFPLFLGNWDGLTADYTVRSLSATEICLEYDIPANEAYFQIYLQPKGMKTSFHTFVTGDFGLTGEVDAEMYGHDGPAVTAEGFEWDLAVETEEEFFTWKSWGGLQVGIGWSANAALHVAGMTLSTDDIPGNIKSVSVTCSYSDETNAKKAELSVKVGGETFGTRKALINDMTTHTFTDSKPASGEIVIEWDSQDEGISYFIRNVEVIYQE